MTTSTISKFVLIGQNYFVKDKAQKDKVKEYYKLIRQHEKPCITVTKTTVCLDRAEGFSREGLSFDGLTQQRIRNTFRLRSISKKASLRLNDSECVFYASYRTKEDALYVANKLAEMSYIIQGNTVVID